MYFLFRSLMDALGFLPATPLLSGGNETDSFLLFHLSAPRPYLWLDEENLSEIGKWKVKLSSPAGFPLILMLLLFLNNADMKPLLPFQPATLDALTFVILIQSVS